MRDIIPFFYYDVLAKIIPGALILAIPALLGASLPAGWQRLFGAEGWKTVVDPLLVTGACYFIGEIPEALFRLSWDGFGIYKSITDRGRAKAYETFMKREEEATKAIVRAKAKAVETVKADPYKEWQRMASEVTGIGGAAFSHAHRFQAEAKLLLHSAAPAAVLVVIGSNRYFGVCPLTCIVDLLLFIGITAFFVTCACNSEERRWIQVLAFVMLDQAGNGDVPKRAFAASSP